MGSKLHDYTHAALRVAAGLLFLQHGLQKLFGNVGGLDGHGGTAPVVSLLGAAGVLEFTGGLLLILGLFTAPVAVILLIEMLYAYVTVHAPQGGMPIQNQGELALLYGAIFLYLAGAGSGPLSVDARIAARSDHERRGPIFDRRAHAA